MVKVSGRMVPVSTLLMLTLALSGHVYADTVYPTSDACWAATHRPCSHSSAGWVPASFVPPEQSGSGHLTDDEEMRVHQLKAMAPDVAGTATNPVVAVDMVQVSFPDVLPYLDPEVNRVRVPIRFISEQMGAKVDWSSDTQTVTVTRDGLRILLRVDDPVATVNDIPIKLDAPPKLLPPGRVMVPLRFISEAFGATVDWVEQAPPAGSGGSWGRFQVWIWVPWGYFGKHSIHERLEVYRWWYHR